MIKKVSGKLFKKNSVPVWNNTALLQWSVDNITKSFINNEKSLTHNLVAELEQLFGKCNKALRLEFYTRLWVLEYKGLTFNVYSAKGKGTSIEICEFSYEDVRGGKRNSDIIEFLEELYKEINKK